MATFDMFTSICY